MAGFDLDPGVLRAAAAELRAVADELDETVRGFVAVLGQYGDPWGVDLLGGVIGGGYVAVEERAVDTLDSAVDGLDGHADGLAAMAAAVTRVEDETVTDLDRLAERV